MRPPSAPAARRSLVGLAALTLALLPATGCTGEGPAVVAAPSPAVGAAAATSPVAELQAGLTALLVERVHLVDAMSQAVAAGEPDAAVEALDEASVALAELLGATYSAAGGPLLEALREYDRQLVQHAAAVARELPNEPSGELFEAQLEVARVLRQVTPTLDVDEVALRLGADVQAQQAAGAYDQLRTAAQDAQRTARLLTTAVAADRGLGRASADGPRWRAELTGLLTEHVMLTGALARELREPGRGSASARAALDANAQALADLVGGAYPELRAPFRRSWTGHLDRMQRYATARAAGVEAVPEGALVQGYGEELARLLAEHVADLPARSAQTELAPALAAQVSAVDAAAAGNAQSLTLLRQASAAMLPAAALLSAAVAEDLRLS